MWGEGEGSGGKGEGSGNMVPPCLPLLYQLRQIVVVVFVVVFCFLFGKIFTMLTAKTN